ncbi:MAG: helix-turn-helix transcriptional regulator [Phaeodactylibacter sp.]|nr:helix-turn-helix transcriptional regulator [Phaeodactylibacter sp.]
MEPNASQQNTETPQFIIVYQPSAGNSRSDEKEQASRPASAKTPAIVQPPFLAKALALMEANLDNPHFTIAHLSRKMGMSYSTLNRKLRGFTGQRAIQVLRGMRLQKAKALLRTGAFSVSEVAYETGFTSPAYFSRVFSRETGLPPSEYRNARQSGPEKIRTAIGCTELSPG